MRKARGFTLVEALIALLVLSIGLLGLAGMQLKALQGAHAGYQRTVASLAAQDAQERLWQALAQSGDLTCPMSSDVNGTGDDSWHGMWSTFLPGLSSSPVSSVSGGECEFLISIAWNESRFGETTETLEYVAKLPGESP